MGGSFALRPDGLKQRLTTKKPALSRRLPAHTH
jgi:hypothetical protein